MENLWVESSEEHIKRSKNGYKRPKNVIKKFPVFFGTKPRRVRLQSLGPKLHSNFDTTAIGIRVQFPFIFYRSA